MRSYQNLKILHVSSEESWRGGEQQIAYLISELNMIGLNNVVLCKAGSAFESYCKKNNIKYYTAGFSSNLDLSSSFRLRSACKIEHPDIIHTHSSRSHSIAVYAYYLGIKTPIVVSRRVDFPIKTIWKYNCATVKRIVCVSNFIQQMVVPKIKNPERCITIYDGIDVDKFKNNHKSKSLLNEFGIDPSFNAVGNTSAIADHKDYFTFVDSAEYVLKHRKDVAFFIIGTGPLKNQIQEYIQSKELEKNIILTGFRTDIIDIISSLDCFLMTSKTEGLGTSVLDSLAAKIPVVSTKAGGIPEIIINGKNGLLSEIGDSKDLGENVLKILKNMEFSDLLVKEGSEYVKGFSYQYMADKTFREYQLIVE